MLSLASIVLYLGVSLAQTTNRPSNATICDFYALRRYGENTTVSQGKLMQSVVSLAFAGRGNIPNINPEITGILNPGVFDNEPVFLRPWFNGSIDSTNLNNQPVALNWLDAGGVAPLYAFLNGTTDTVQIAEGSNELYALPLYYQHGISNASQPSICTLLPIIRFCLRMYPPSCSTERGNRQPSLSRLCPQIHGIKPHSPWTFHKPTHPLSCPFRFLSPR